MIHPITRIAAAAVREGCPEAVARSVASAVLRAAGSEMTQRGASPDFLWRWADELDERDQ